MRIKFKCACRQACALLALLALAGCIGKKEEAQVMPPVTSPLSQAYIGYGVVNVSYARVVSRPDEGSPEGAEETASAGYLRRGSVVSIVERQLVKSQGKPESWVLVEGSGSGWLRESFMDIYESELQAKTASEEMGR